MEQEAPNRTRRLEPRWWPADSGPYQSGVGAVSGGHFPWVQTDVCAGRGLGTLSALVHWEGQSCQSGPLPHSGAQGPGSGHVFGGTSTVRVSDEDESFSARREYNTVENTKILKEKQECREWMDKTIRHNIIYMHRGLESTCQVNIKMKVI